MFSLQHTSHHVHDCLMFPFCNSITLIKIFGCYLLLDIVLLKEVCTTNILLVSIVLKALIFQPLNFFINVLKVSQAFDFRFKKHIHIFLINSSMKVMK